MLTLWKYRNTECVTDLQCTTGGYCLQIKNYAGVQWVSQNVIPCEKFTPLTQCAIKWKREVYFGDTSYNRWPI